MENIGYLASILMGLSLGLIGGGGSILTVSILVYLFHVNPIIATGYSLFIVGSTSLVGGFFNFLKGNVDIKTGLMFSVPSFMGVYITRAYIVPSLPDPVFSLGSMTVAKPVLIMAVFAILMLAASTSMIRGRKERNKNNEDKRSVAATIALVSVQGFVVGGVTGFVGAGGGFLIIPALVVLVGLPMKIAIGTSLVIISINSLIGFLGDLQHQSQMDWGLLLSISGIAILGFFIGMSLSSKISDQKLKKGFGYFVLIMGAFILLDQIQRM